MSTTNLTAAEVMDRSAALLNDPAKTDYTYAAQLAYLNMAIDELVESLEETNSSPANMVSTVLTVLIGGWRIVSVDTNTVDVPTPPNYPFDLVEIQEIGERTRGTSDPFIPMGRRDFIQAFPVSNSFMYWAWMDQEIRFNPNGALTDREIQLKYVRQGVAQALDANTIIGTINARSYLSFKTAAFCAMYIGENETRAALLDAQAERAIERLIGINNKGRQQISTRHRPFRASYKARGGF